MKLGKKKEFSFSKPWQWSLWTTITKFKHHVLDINYCPTSGFMSAVL